LLNLEIIIITNAPHQKKEMAPCPSYINDLLESEVIIVLCCPTCYTAVQINNCLKSTFAIKVATLKNMDDFPEEVGSIHVLLTFIA